jgi:LysR family transcriptional repressor of citA
MDIRWLRTFVAAARYENFRHAAETLFLAQPTVTVHIKQLENILGVSLFERKGRNIALSPAGRRFLPKAAGILEMYDAGIHDLESWRQGYDRKLTLAVSPLIAASTLPWTLRRFVDRHPNIEVFVQVLESKDIAEAVNAGDADLGLSRMGTKLSGLDCQKLEEEPVVLVAPHDGGDFESSPPVDAEQLLQEQLILTHNHPEYWDELLYELRNKYRSLRTMVVSQVHITKRFIEEGLGISFLPLSSVRRELLEGRLLEVHTELIRLPTASTYLIRKTSTPESESFVRLL